jgi:HD-like signal output (HDOD) protein
MNEIAPAADGSPAGRTLTSVREALARSDTACVTQVLEIIKELSDKADHLSVQDLAELIGRDLTMVAKIMKAANCLGYNPAAVDVTTLTEAISVVGFEKIRNLVISLLLIENAEQRGGAQESRDVAAQALSSALVAQVIIQQTTSINPEQAFVCATLRHYGRLLLSTFLSDSYREALELSNDMPFDAACNFIFGLTPLELGRRILGDTHLPKVIERSLQVAPLDTVNDRSPSESDRLLVVSEFSCKLCDLLGTPGLTQADLDAGLGQLLKTYVRSVALTDKDLKTALCGAEQMLSTFSRAQGLQSLSNPLMNRLRLLAEGRPVPATPGHLRKAIPAMSGTSFARNPDPITAGIAEVNHLLANPPVDSHRAFAAAARCLRAGLRMQSCMVFLQDTRQGLFAAAVGSGALFDEIRNRPVLDPRNRNVFTVCLTRGEDVLIQNPTDSKIAPFIPEWFKHIASSGPFALLPVKDADGTFAIICGSVTATSRLDLGAIRNPQVKNLRALLNTLRAGTEQQQAA